jgi:hypothetical protein
MVYVILAIIPLLIAGQIYLISRFTKSRPSDYESIDAMLKARSLQKIAVTKDNNYFRYWIRGLGLSNVARIYIVTAAEQNGSRREIHVAFDDWSSSGELQVLLDRELSTQRVVTDSPPSELGSTEAVAEFLKQREALKKAKQDSAEPGAAPDPAA